MTEYLFDIGRASFNLINTASAWIVISYIIAGALHDLIPVEKLHKHLGNKSFFGQDKYRDTFEMLRGDGIKIMLDEYDMPFFGLF